MSENIKQPPELSENAVEQAINAAKKNIAQLSHLKECVLEINMRENYICIDKIDEQNNANQWARIALYDRKGNDCSLMLYDKEWRDCYNGSFRACFEELDCKNVVLDSMPIIDETSKTNETADDIGEVTELSQSDKDAINTSLASDMRKQVEFSKEDTKVIKSVVEDAIAQLPRLK